MEELAQCLFLSFLQKIIVIHQFVQVFQVTEERFCIGHVLVCVVKVGNKHFSPEVKIIEGFFASGGFLENLVQIANQLYRVGNGQFGRLAEQFADADVGGRPDRTVAFLSQIFIEEQAGTLVREYNRNFRKVAFGFFI